MAEPSLKSQFRAAVYAGSFSPITRGHHDIIMQAASAFDRLYVAVGVNPGKKPLFTVAERVAMIEQDITDIIQPALKAKGIECDIRVTDYQGATARFMESVSAPFYVRGLRLGTEFDDESPAIVAGKKIYNKFTPVFFCSTEEGLQTVSSSIARGLCELGEDEALESYVSPHIKNALIKRMDERKLRP